MTIFQKQPQSPKHDTATLRHFAAKENRQILMRYTCVYIAYLLVLLTVLFAAINVSSNLMEQKSVRLAEEVVSAGIEELELTLDAYERAASTLMNSRELQSIVYGPDGGLYGYYEVHQFFTAVTQSLESLPNCGYFLTNGDLIVPAAYFQNPEFYFSQQMSCADFPDYKTWYTYIRSVTGSFAPAMTYLNSDDTETEAILYLIRRGSGTNYQMFYVMIPVDHIAQLLTPSSQSAFGNTTLSVPYGSSTLVLYQDELYDPAACPHTITVTGSSGLTVTVDISDSYIESEMKEARVGFYMFTWMFILIGLLFAIIMAYHNTRPLTLLLKAATQYDTTGQFNAPTSRMNKEYKYLLSILSNSSAALKSYEKELERYSAETQYWSFVGMLMGEETDMANSLYRPPYALLMIAPDGEEHETCSLLLSLIRKYIGTTISHAGFLCVFRNAVIILVEESVLDNVTAGVTEILDTIPDLLFRQVSVLGLTTPTAIRDAYAQSAYMLTLPSTNGALRQELKLVSKPTEATDANELFMQFGVSTISGLLVSGQIDTLTKMFDDCIAFFRSGGYADETSVRYIYASCAVSLSVIRTKFPDITADIKLPDFASYSSVQNMLTSLCTILKETHERIRASYEKSNITEKDEIIEYIAAHISDPELYSKMVMEKFGLTTRELQGHVKDATGMSFFHFVEKMRMDRAKHLLLTTSQSVTSIGEACGYNSNTVFNRAYSRYYGISPAETRRRAEAGEGS